MHEEGVKITDPWRELGQVVAVHKRLMDLLTDMTGLKKRALASKYLHFHRPDLFFIYDSSANGAIVKVTPHITKIPKILAKQADDDYLTLVRRCHWIREDIAQRFNTLLTPRQVDKILLRIADRIKKGRTNGSTVRAAANP